MSRFYAVLSALFLLAGAMFASVAQAAITTVSVGFESGFVGEYSNGAHQPVSIKTFATLGVDSVTISQSTDNGQFGGSQGNDYSVTVRIQFSNGTTSTFPAAVNWRDTQGSTIHGIGLTVAASVNDATGYTVRNGYSKTFLLQFVGSARVYSDTATGASSGTVSGNAATNGLLSALNSYLASAPASTTPSSLTSTITAAHSSIAANGTSTTTITVQLKDVNGNNLTSGGDTVTLSTSAGTLSNVTDNGDGTYTATLTSSTSVTTATVTGTVEGFAISDDAQVQFVSTASVAGTLTRANGSAVSGRTVKLVNGSSQIVATTTTAANGTYSFTAVAPGTYSVQFESSGSYKAKAKSATGSNQGNIVSSVTVGSSSTITGVDAVVIDPAGIIYSSTTRAPLANAVASLWYNNAKVSNSWLDTGLGGANDQTTGADGFYSFVLNSSASTGTYEIRVIAPAGYTGTPSSNIPAGGTYTPSLGGGLESIQSQPTAPTGAQPTTYYLLFSFTIGANAASTSNGVINNHIPLDPVIAAPVFTNTNATDGASNPSYSFTYDENRASGATLGTVSATGTGALSYSITSGNGSSWFAIDPTTGVITLTQAGSTSLANDYETTANLQTLTVQVSDGTRTTTIEVKLNERNVDDTPPVITGPRGTAGALTDAISVNENQTAVTTLTADEPVTWSLVGGEDQAKFTIDPSTGVLTFIAAPDYEAPTDGTTSGSNTYIVQVKALDATGTNFSVQTITVTVLDVNEATAPVFTNTNATDGSSNPSYSFTYDENRAVGTTLGTVSATGTGTLTYSITAGNGSSWFAIDPTTGVITLTQAGSTSLANDYETVANVQTLTVQVSDGTRTTTIEAKLNERNVDDTPPVITGPGGTAGALTDAISVNENQSAVTTLTADEPVTWSLVGGEDQAKFTIDPSTGVLTFIAAPDYEAPTDGSTSGSNTYIAQVKATDAAGNVSLQTITVTVLDVNEATAPVFTNTNATDGASNPSYSFTYDENRASGATLGTVSATGTGALSYSITSGNGSSWFAIDPTTGVITLTQAGSTSLANDYETTANLQTLTVQVSDGTRTTTIEVKLNERNVDDTPPVITGPRGTAGALTDAISVNENQTGVTTLTADEPVTWSLVGGEDQAKFTIDPSTGVLTFIAAPDYEAPTDGTTSGSNTYIVQVKATDAAGNVSLQTITVTVLDVNEATAPVFTNTNATDGSSNPSYAFTYDENRAVGATLGTVSATGTGTLSYSITSGNGSSWFAIDPTTGVITLTQTGSTSLANDYETTANLQTLTVQVSDGTRTTTIEVKLNERNVDDIAYTSISGALTRANRSTGGGAAIGIGGRTVTLVDANNHVVATATTAANGSYAFDHVAPGTYAVQFGTALATSQTGTVSGSTVSNISVVGGMTVTHVDAIIIDPSGVVYDAVRRTPISNALVSLYFGGAKVSNNWLDLTLGGANDQTTGADGRYSFILAGTASSGTYEIRVTGPSGYLNTESTLIPSSGTVTPVLGGGLDNVQPQSIAPTGTQATTYYLRFAFTIGTDAASTSNGIANNHIPLDPVAAPLAFTGTNATDAGSHPSYSFNYNEGRSVGATLGTVSASGGYSANRTFSITGGNSDGWFTVDPATGVISLTAAGAASAANDFETDVNVHILTVQVADGFGTASIEVKLNEVNLDDSVPLITGPNGGAGAAESSTTIDEGLTLATTMSANETVTWSLIGGADQAQFVIDPATGALSFVAAPNYETPTDADRNNSYVVQVRAIDANGNVAVQTVTVTIRNVDEIARKLAQIADPLRNGLLSYAARSLGDMLSFNEQLLGDDDGGQCNVQKDKPVSGGFNANNQAQSARLNYTQRMEDCERKYRVYLNGALAVSRLHGDWMTRTLASARVETDLSPTFVVGAGVLTTFADDKIRGFATSDISDTSVQLNLYGRKRLTDTLRMAGFVGYGKAWYDFGLTDNGFVMTGKMTGNRYTYGATLTGDIVIDGTPVTTDLIVSRAQERLGSAKLAATYGGEQRSGIGFYVGNVDVTRLSVPVHLPIDFQKSAYEGGNSASFEFSPGLLCEDNSVDQSSLSCGFKADAKLLVTRGTRSHAYLDASFETVNGLERYMGGLGFGYRFGPKDALEIGTNVDVGTAGVRPEARAMIQLKLAQ